MRYKNPYDVHIVEEPLTDDPLTPIELTILGLWGKGARAIANQIGCTVPAVNSHAQRARTKLGVHTTEAAAMVVNERSREGHFKEYNDILETYIDAMNRRDMNALSILHDINRYSERSVLPRMTLDWDGSLEIFERYCFAFSFQIKSCYYQFLPDGRVLRVSDVSGHHKGEFFGIKKTGNYFSLRSSSFHTFSDDGKILRDEADWDANELLLMLDESPHEWWKWFYRNDEFLLPRSVLSTVAS